MYASLRALIEPVSIQALTKPTYMVLTTLAFGYLAFIVLIAR
jgi:hypothetical protein